ncbi:lipopolysaccharide transport system permease protein [Chitinivorax tropicus]|uniref:Transport permease protein n=1 Tax=Chitinivorax tropicus TaxID=714531 RepID=A0A840MTV8_9PROT|nr:ABC transporter permease [Chitinivorax tropicus]MBB5020519.1 lipopolysaccharide transport system permease protein [Chitinivorax tropicus]
MQNFSISPAVMIASLWINRNLLVGLVHREIIGRYKGSTLGILWSFFNPVLMLAVYTFFFSVIFQTRWLGGSGSKTEFALILFAGLLVFNFFAECMNRSPSLILSNVNYVKKIVFPLELLPIVAMGSAGFHLLVSFFVWLGFYVVIFGIPHLGVLLFPVVLVPLALLTLGFTWFLSSLGVYLRDVSQVVGALVPVLMFLSPVFYPLKSLPEEFRAVVHLSPITVAVEQTREVMYWGGSIDWSAWGGYLVISCIIAWLGFAWFQRTRKGFADVL